ncbi:hypothetical protein NM208_g5130 [Fusarium decemcellulare]|uniref:Uncharacterized protein n=1 Tax=Fusarium decemcellulare TaxID=57161 RepID=A0ACC1SHZ9_9HYPO|nr:hypothetical protein NM208_g5130 [Fusarium decemcellulare]
MSPHPSSQAASTPALPQTDSERHRKRRKTAIACQNCRSRKVRTGDGVANGYLVYNVIDGQDDTHEYIQSLKQKLQMYERKSSEGQIQPADCEEAASPARNPQPTDWQGNAFYGSDPRQGQSASTISTHTSSMTILPRASGYGSDGRTLTDQSPSIDNHSGHEPPSSHYPAVRDLIKQGYMGDSSSASFMNNLRRTVRARNSLGVGNSEAEPLPRLTLIELGPKSDSTAALPHDENLALPPRHIANSLMDTYWRNNYPLYPAVDRSSFQSCYEAIWSGSSLGGDETMTHCILNLMLALAAQSTGPAPPGCPNTIKQTPYISRARNLMRPVLLTGWSFQLVQAIILYAQYLQSTDDPHQCWTVVGMAIRMAESMGLHIASTSRNLKNPMEKELARRVWYCCVTLDRVVSMTLGRSPTISMSSANAVDRPSIEPPVTASNPGDNSHPERHQNLDIFVYSLLLFNILHQILLNFYAPNQTLEKDDVPAHLSTVMDLEENLQDWVQSLPPHLRTSSDAASSSKIQTSLLKLRYVNVRLLLYRPILSFTILRSSRSEYLPRDLPVRTAALLACSTACIESALDMASFTYHEISTDASSSQAPASPWWYNVCYSYTAATAILAARVSVTLVAGVGMSNLDSGIKQCVSVLEHYKAMFPSASRCLAALSHIALDLETDMTEQAASRNTERYGPAHQLDLTNQQLLMDYSEGGFVDASWLDSVPFDLLPDQWLQPEELTRMINRGSE